MSDAEDEVIEEQQGPSITRKVIEIVGDAFAYVRSAEANAALATVTLEELIGDQIKRNGETSESGSEQFNPYVYESDKESPAGGEPEKRANFLGGTDTNAPSKLDFILAIQSELSAVIEEVKANPPSDEEYTESVEKGFAEEDVTTEGSI